MTPSRNRQDTPERRGRKAPLPEPNAGGTVLALLRVGTRRCRLTAAFMAVVAGLLGQTANGAFAEARQTVLYLDAPAVSTERASRAGEVAGAYADPGSSASPETLAWLDVPVRPADPSTPPAEAEAAFASVTAPDGERPGGLIAAAALEAGEVMLAQIEASPSGGESPSDAGGADEEMAEAGAVRPQLGDGTRAPAGSVAEPATQPEQRPEPGGSDAPAGPDAPEYASGPVTPGTTEDPAAEPGGGAGLVVPAPSSDGAEEPEEPSLELAAAPSDTGESPGPFYGAGDEPYGPTGPISTAGEGPQEGLGSDESDPEAEPTEGEGGLARTRPAGAEPVEGEPEESDPSAVPAGAETGPTGEEGEGEIALVPVSASPSGGSGSTEPPPPAAPPAAEETEELASADPPPGPEPADEAGGEHAEIVLGGEEPSAAATPGAPTSARPSEERPVVETQSQEVTVVQGSTTGETAAGPAAPVTRGEAEGEGAPPEDGGSPAGEETPVAPEADVPNEPAPGSADEPAPESAPDPGGDANGRDGTDTAGGTGRDGSQTQHGPPAGSSGDPAAHTGAGTQHLPDEDAPSVTPPAGGPPPPDLERGDEANHHSDDPDTAGGVTPTTGDTDAQGGDQQDSIPQGEAPRNDLPQGDAPQRGAPHTGPSRGDAPQPPAGTTGDPPGDDPQPARDRDARERRAGGNGQPEDPTDRVERTKETDAGGEAVQERAQEADSPGGGGDTQDSPAMGPEESVAPQPLHRGGPRDAGAVLPNAGLDDGQRPGAPDPGGSREPARLNPRGTGGTEQAPAAIERQPAVERAVERAALREQRQPDRQAALAAGAQTYAGPTPGLFAPGAAHNARPAPREPVYREPVPQEAPQRPEPASHLPSQQLDPAPQVPAQEAATGFAPAQRVQGGGGVQISHVSESLDQAAGR